MKKRNQVKQALSQLFTLSVIGGFLVAGGYWMGRSDEAENPHSPAYAKGFADGQVHERQAYGKDFLTEIDERVAADRGELPAQRSELQNFMDAL